MLRSTLARAASVVAAPLRSRVRRVTERVLAERTTELQSEAAELRQQVEDLEAQIERVLAKLEQTAEALAIQEQR
ncbi:MAG: hypothetical protein KDA24_02105 [Deltaproteobacteria bacterium]|nr:hypothetical protein [Deltaproteobacteria bacterium]